MYSARRFPFPHHQVPRPHHNPSLPCYADQLIVKKARLVLQTDTPAGDMSVVQAKEILRAEVARILSGGLPIPN